MPAEKTQLFESLKQLLRQRKVTYGQIAKRLGASESSIKRIFSIEECSLSRLIEIAGCIDLSLHDLIEYSNQREVSTVEFTTEAEEVMALQPELFFVYRKLFFHRDVEEVARRENLSNREMTAVLKQLDSLGVIEWLPGNQVSFPYKGFLRFRKNGPLKKAVYRKWIPKFQQTVLNNIDSPDHEQRLFSGRCTAKSRDLFLQEYEEIVARFLQRASLDVKTMADVQPICVSLAAGPTRVGLDARDFMTQP